MTFSYVAGNNLKNFPSQATLDIYCCCDQRGAGRKANAAISLLWRLIASTYIARLSASGIDSQKRSAILHPLSPFKIMAARVRMLSLGVLRGCMNEMPLATLAVAFISVLSFAQRAATKDPLVGIWKVVTLKASSEGKVSYPLGDQVAGYVGITPDRIWFLFVDSTRKPPDARRRSN